jgi:hypothetical protein
MESRVAESAGSADVVVSRDRKAAGGGRAPKGRDNHQSESAGNTFPYFTLLRGDAIIGATVSRQIA